MRVGDRWYDVDVGDLDSNPVMTVVDGVPVEVSLGGLMGTAHAPQPSPNAAEETGRTPLARKHFYSPAAGVIASVVVDEGNQVVTGDEICILDAKEGHKTLRADWSGVIKTVNVSSGQEVREGDLIAEFK